MTQPSFLGLVHNASLLLALSLLFDVATSRWQFSQSKSREALVGVLIGAIGITIMLTPWVLLPGLVFDTRSVLLGISGLFFGALPTIFAMLMTAAFRVYRGGAGMWMGVAVIISTGTIGIIWGYLRRKPLEEITFRELYTFGILIHLVMLALAFILPLETALQTLKSISIPVLLIYPIGTALVGILMATRLRNGLLLHKLRKSERKLFESDQRFHRLLRHAPAILYQFSATTGGIYYSPRTSEYLGYSPQELQDSPFLWYDSIHPEDVAQVDQAIKECISGKEIFLTYRVRHASGRWRWFHDRAVSTVSDNGDKIIDGIAEDVTARKQAEEALMESNLRFHKLVQSIPVGVYSVVLNTDGSQRFEYASSRLCSLLKVTPDEVMNDPERVLTLVHPEDKDSLVAANKRAAEMLVPFDWEGRFIISGETRWIHLKSEPTITGAHTSRWDGIVSDITEKKLADEEKTQNSLRIISLYNISQHPYTTEDAFLDHALNEVIRLTQSMIGYIYHYDEARGEFTLNSWSSGVMKECKIIQPQTVYLLDGVGIWGEAVRQKKPIILNDFEAYHPLKKGLPEGHAKLSNFLTIPVIVENSIVAVVGVANKAGHYTDEDVMQVTLFMDAVWKIISAKRSEAEKTTLKEQLHHSQRLESIGRLAGGVAHDFNNKLMIIMGNAELARMYKGNEAEIEGFLAEILRAAEQSRDITFQLLAFSRQQVVTPRLLQPNQVIAETLKSLRRIIGEDVKLIFSPSGSSWNIKVDPVQLDQVIMNLAVNARDAMPEGGQFTIEVENVLVDRDFCSRCSDAAPGAYVAIIFSDTGTGISRVHLQHIFEPFYTTKAVGKGTGLGLATLYGIVRQNNGFVTVDSEVGKGTIFKIYLPRHDGTSGVEQIEAKETPSGSGSVLLVEDDASVREITSALLSNLGYRVMEADTPHIALETAKDTGIHLDLVISDVIMPEMNGMVLFNRIRTYRPHVPVLFVSGYSSEHIPFNTEEGIDFIQKPYGRDVLNEKIQQILSKKRDPAAVTSGGASQGWT